MLPAWIAILGLCSACATQPPAWPDDPPPGSMDVYDPIEGINRGVYRFNARFDQYVFLPGLRAYRFVLPAFVRARFSDFMNNLAELPRFMNSVLQLHPQKSATTLGRFMFNSTWGIGGLFDLAGFAGVHEVDEDFGQTLGYYGVGPGPYLVLPLIGPSNLRDAGGMLVDRGVQGAVQGLVIGNWLAQHPYVYLPMALQYRDEVPFRYGELGPFEYDLIRFLFTEYRAVVAGE